MCSTLKTKTTAPLGKKGRGGGGGGGELKDNKI